MCDLSVTFVTQVSEARSLMSPNLKQPPSANWLALQKVREPSFYRQRRVFKLPQEIASDPPHRREKRKSGHETVPDQRFKRGESSSSSAVPAPTRVASQLMPRLHTGMKKGESIDSLRRMILGELEDRYTGHQKQYVSENRTPRNSCRLIFIKARKIRRPRLRNGRRGYRRQGVFARTC